MPAIKLSEHQAEVSVVRRLLGLFDEASLFGVNPDLPSQGGDWVSTSEGKVLMEADEPVITATLHIEVWDRPLPSDETWTRTKTVNMMLMSGKLAVDENEYGTRPIGFRLPTPGQWEVRLSWRTVSVDHASVLAQFWPLSASSGRRHPRAMSKSRRCGTT